MVTAKVTKSDAIEFLKSLDEQSVDLIFSSPPYSAEARTYGIDFNLKGQEWVDWMVEVFKQSLRVCRGLVAYVVEGSTRKFRYNNTPILLAADLHRAGIHLRKPPVFQRVGIPGSGGPDWLRNDYEFVICATNGGRLPWSENTAMGHPPKWGPGGEMSHRLSDGTRRNQWGHSGTGEKGARKRCGDRQGCSRPSHKITKTGTPRQQDGDREKQVYTPPKNANPGNVIKAAVGGGVMGDRLCHENEAPFPEKLAEFFVRSFCPPEGTVVDPFSGSGTTLSVAIQNNRNAIGADIRQSQVELTNRRIAPHLNPETAA